MSVVLIEKLREAPSGVEVWLARLDFAVEGKSGTRQTVRVSVDRTFRASRLSATDTSPTPGGATTITDVRVEDGTSVIRRAPRLSSSQFPRPEADQPPTRLPTAVFAERKVEIKWDTAQVGNVVEFDVEFAADCAWSASVEGDAIFEPRPIAELVAQDRAHNAERVLRAQGDPLYYYRTDANGPDYGFGIIPPESAREKFRADGFYEDPDPMGRSQVCPWSTTIERMTQYALMFERDCVLILTPGLRVDLTHAPAGWRIKLTVRAFREPMKRAGVLSAAAVVKELRSVITSLATLAEGHQS